jgi:hypothetical protein
VVVGKRCVIGRRIQSESDFSITINPVASSSLVTGFGPHAPRAGPHTTDGSDKLVNELSLCARPFRIYLGSCLSRPMYSESARAPCGNYRDCAF